VPIIATPAYAWRIGAAGHLARQHQRACDAGRKNPPGTFPQTASWSPIGSRPMEVANLPLRRAPADPALAVDTQLDMDATPRVILMALTLFLSRVARQHR